MVLLVNVANYVLGQLRKTEWGPGHTLVLWSWDAEEFSLMGPTEWAKVCNIMYCSLCKMYSNDFM